MGPLHRGLERVSGRMEGSNKKARGARGEIKGEVERGASRCALWLGMRGTRRFGIMNSGDVTSLGGGRTVAAAPRAVEGAVEALAPIGPDGVDARRRIFALVCASCALVDVCMWRSTQQCVCMWWRNDNRMGGVSPSRRVHTHTQTHAQTPQPHPSPYPTHGTATPSCFTITSLIAPLQVRAEPDHAPEFPETTHCLVVEEPDIS